MVEGKKWSPLGKRHNWVQRGGGEAVYELIVWENGRKLDRFIWNTQTKYREILNLLSLKFGMEYK